MTQEDKELLLKDLCGRLPYGVKVNVIYSNENASSFRQRVCVEGDNELNTDIIGLYQCNEIEIKPYLFPMSSMTDEVKKVFAAYFKCIYLGDSTNFIVQLVEWLNENHFDCRGLIEKGLALDATDKDIY